MADPIVASMLKSTTPSGARKGPTPWEEISPALRVLVVIGVCVAVAWFLGYLPNTNRYVFREAGHGSAELVKMASNVMWDKEVEKKGPKCETSRFAKAISENTTVSQREMSNKLVSAMKPERRVAYATWVINTRYGNPSPHASRVDEFVDICINGPDKYMVANEGDCITDEQKNANAVANTAVALGDYTAEGSTRKLYNSESGMCIAYDAPNKDFKKDLVSCQNQHAASGFDVINDRVVVGDALCYPFELSRKKNILINSTPDQNIKNINLTTHPCLANPKKVKKDKDGYIIGVGDKCFTSDQGSGKNLRLDFNACKKGERKMRFELKEGNEIVSGMGFQDLPSG